MKFLKIILAMIALLVITSPVNAVPMEDASMELETSRPSQPGLHTFNFTHVSADTIKTIEFEYCKNPSGACTPTATVLTDAGLAISAEDLPSDDWTAADSANKIVITSAAGATFTGLTGHTVAISNITNGPMSDACDGSNDDRDTCYVRIASYTATPVLVDSVVVTFTLLSAIDVTAKVDPTFTFVIAGVNSGVTNNGVTTSVTSDATSLPFGSLQAGTPKYAAHSLKVTTNTAGGYTISANLIGDIEGVYAGNKIDNFIAPWSTPTTWTEPTGTTPNTNTGWFGANITDNDVTNWTGVDTGLFGWTQDTTPVTVAYKDSSDDGQVADFVSYAIEANVFQPSDSYRGTLVYNALPVY